MKNLGKNMKEITDIARENIIASKERAKEYYDRYLNEVVFEEGDLVWMIKEPIPGKLEKDHNSGPFEMLKINERRNYNKF